MSHTCVACLPESEVYQAEWDQSRYQEFDT